MARSRTTAEHTSATPTSTLAWEASLDAGYDRTRIKVTGAAPGGHSVYVIAERPDGRREEAGIFTWDGERGDIVLPYVARRIRVMNAYEDVNRVEAVVDVLQDFIEDNQPDPEEPPPDPPADPEPSQQGEPSE
jgi:hypothetical protein